MNQESYERDSFINWLKCEYSQRTARNPRYSLRAFAKHLQMDSSTLSQILTQKRPLSKSAMSRIAKHLGLTPADIKQLLNSEHSTLGHYQAFESKKNETILNWYCYAILELTFTKNFQSDSKWIAAQVGITNENAAIAIENLIESGLLQIQDGVLSKTKKYLTNATALKTSDAHRQLQKSIIEKAAEADEDYPPEEKDITSMTFAINENKLEDARAVIARFRREMALLLEDGPQTRVYNLGIQLYPISKKNNGDAQ